MLALILGEMTFLPWLFEGLSFGGFSATGRFPSAFGGWGWYVVPAAATSSHSGHHGLSGRLDAVEVDGVHGEWDRVGTGA